MRLEVRIDTSSHAGKRLSALGGISSKSPFRHIADFQRSSTRMVHGRMLTAECCFLIRDHALYFGRIGLIDQRAQIQAPLRLLRLGSKNVAHERMPALHVTVGGLLEAFGSATMGLQFWHGSSANNSNPQRGVACWGGELSICDLCAFWRIGVRKNRVIG